MACLRVGEGVGEVAVSRFYRVCEVLGLLGTAWIGGLLVYLGAPLWTWLVTVPAFVLVEFGCFASRDRKHEQAQRAAS